LFALFSITTKEKDSKNESELELSMKVKRKNLSKVAFLKDKCELYNLLLKSCKNMIAAILKSKTFRVELFRYSQKLNDTFLYEDCGYSG
jgi:hypothetical protein